ncbi:MAG: aminodeoxychorismate lyase, partial [Maribacter sp.]
MYIKRILLGVLLLGLLGGGIFAYYVYSAFFTPNTSFNNDEAFVYLPTGATATELQEQLAPLLDDMDSFKA